MQNIPGHSSYLASEDGKIFSDKGRARRELSVKTTRAGYRRVRIVNDEGKPSDEYVHRLVLLAFKGEPPHNHVAIHNNGEAGDNRLLNLRWGLRSAKARKSSELSADEIYQIKLKQTCNITDEELVAEYDTDLSTIRRIRAGKIGGDIEV